MHSAAVLRTIDTIKKVNDADLWNLVGFPQLYPPDLTAFNQTIYLMSAYAQHGLYILYG